MLPSVAVAQQVTPFTPVGGGEYRGPVAQSVLPSVETAMRVTPFTPVGGGVFMGNASAPVRWVSPTGALPAAQPAASFLGA